jgi:hypothetical protein
MLHATEGCTTVTALVRLLLHIHTDNLLLPTAKVLRQRRKAYVDQLAKLAHSMQAELLRQKDFKPRQVRIILLVLE